MRVRRFAVLAVGVFVAATVAAAAAADGGPSPGISFGGAGLLRPDGKVRYVAVPTTKGTTIESIRVSDGQVLRWMDLRGQFLGIPLVAYDGTTGGLSRDGRTLVLSTFPSRPVAGGGSSHFALFNTHSFRITQHVVLRGSYAFDALSPDGSTLYLIQYTSAQNINRYRVRAYDFRLRRLVPGAIVDKREPAEAMQGAPMTRAVGPGGRWVFTLYTRPAGTAFIHALDAANRSAVCVDLPWKHVATSIFNVRMKVTPTGLLLSQPKTGKLAVVDTRTFSVQALQRPSLKEPNVPG
jgi:hypothetical protein